MRVLRTRKGGDRNEMEVGGRGLPFGQVEEHLRRSSADGPNNAEPGAGAARVRWSPYLNRLPLITWFGYGDQRFELEEFGVAVGY